MRLAVIFYAVASICLAGCSMSGSKQLSVGESQQRLRLRELERDLRRKQIEVSELRERNLVLEKKVLEQKRVPATPNLVAPQAPTQTNLEGVTSERAHSASPVEPDQNGEQRIYSKVLESYRSHNFAELQKSTQLLLKTYPDSVYADNALYTTGLLAFEMNDSARASQYMDRVIREYPKGNKSVSALFAKAMIERRNRRYQDAREILRNIQKLYPGSPEAARATLETKIIDMQATQKREG